MGRLKRETKMHFKAFTSDTPSFSKPHKFGVVHIPLINHTQWDFNHGLPYFSFNTYDASRPNFGKDILDYMIEDRENNLGPEWLIMFDQGAHFANSHPIVLYNRLVEIKESARRLKRLAQNSKNSKFSKTKIIFKTFNYVRGNYANTYGITSGIVPLWQRDIVLKVFGNPYLNGTEGYENYFSDDEKFPVKVLDVFPMSLAIFDHFEVGNVHPIEIVARETGHMMVNLLRILGYFD